MKRILFALFLMVSSFCALAQDTLDVMFYNVYRFPSATPTQREVLLRDILDAQLPDVFMVCELETEEGADRILNTSFSNARVPYQRAAFVSNQSDTTDWLQQMIYFNSNKFTLLNQQLYVTGVRDINRYTLLLNTTDVATDSVIFEFFVAHLKSSTGTANVTARFNMIDTFVNVLAQIPADRNVFFAGDFNMYRSSELGYQHLIDTLNRSHIMVDPIYGEGSWQDKPEFAYMHTQATRTSRTGFGLYGAGGGMDDRFDFIFMSKQLEDTSRSVFYVDSSYVAFGNNGNCLNMAVNNDSCSGVYDAFLRQNLHDMSDHLPVRLKLATTKTLGAPPVDTSTSIPSINSATDFHILGSNVVYNQLSVIVKYANVPALNARISVIDILGNERLASSIQQANGVYTFDVSALPSGVYFIRLSDATKSLKFVKP